MKTSIFCLVLLCGMALSAGAQERTTMGLHYQYALPMGALKKDFISKGSPRGIDADIMYAVNPKWRVGGAASYQDFYQKNNRSVYGMDDGSEISAVISNSLQTTALQARAYFTPMGADSTRLQPFVTAGAGVNLLQYEQLLGEFNNGSDAVLRFAAHGGVGLKYTIGKKRQTELVAKAVYNHMPLNAFDLKNASNISFGAGVRFALRNNGGSGRRGGDVWQQRRPNNYYRNGW